jgi:hypothetical protein
MKTLLASLLLGVALGLAASQARADEKDQDETFDRTPQDCVSLTRISRTEVIDEQTILFHMSGRQIYRNQLPEACHGLSPHDPFMYEPRSLSPRLCSSDYIDLLDRFGAQYTRGRSCRLGQFYPMTKEEFEDFKRKGPAPVEVRPVELPPAASAPDQAADEPSADAPAKDDD